MKYKHLEFPPVYGLWEVTTEGDCEGKTTKHLGIHEGNIDEIAFNLASSAYYSLSFKPVSPILDHLKKNSNVKSVNVTLDLFYGSCFDKTDQVKAVDKWLKSRPNVAVEVGQYYNSVKLINKSAQDREEIKRKALEKLSEEEREILGL